jgi:hypothetical protein
MVVMYNPRQHRSSNAHLKIGDEMKRKNFVCIGALLLLAAGIVSAVGTDAFMGTWKINEAKSKIIAGTTKNSTVVYLMVGDNVNVAIDGTDAKGQAYHSDWKGKFDGKDYALTGDPANDMRSYKVIDDHTLLTASKKGGKEISTAHIVLSTDGKTRTVTLSGTDASGAKITSTTVYDKQ